MVAIPTADTARTYTAAEFERYLRLPEHIDRRFELVDGRIVEKMPTEEYGMIAANSAAALGAFVRQHRLGRVGVEVRYHPLDDPLNVRVPDLSFSSTRRPLVREGSVPHLPDLAVEIRSPDDTITAMREKAAYYLANGVRLVWLVYPTHRFVEVYRPDADVTILFADGVLTGGDVLPGFELPVAEVFADSLEG
jgi:Uma2 family endonuclease